MKYVNIRNICFMMIFVVCILLILSLHPTFILDESFTFGLIEHNYLNIIYLSSMDVHPPLYYIILKLFLSISTFWTHSMFIEVIMGRLLSILMLVISIYFCNKILCFCKCNYYPINSMLIFLLMPSIIPTSTKIRMYSMSALFIVLELYELIKFVSSNKIRYIFIAALFIALSAYTFYFAGLSAIVLLFILGLMYLIQGEFVRFKNILIGITIVFIIYLPQIPIVLNQMNRHKYINNGNWVNAVRSLFSSMINAPFIIAILLIVPLVFIIVFSVRSMNKRFNKVLFLVTIDLLTTILISFIICGKQFQNGVSYPIGFIFTFMISKLISVLIHDHRETCHVLSFLVIVLLMFTEVVQSGITIKRYDIPSITLCSNVSNWEHSRSKNIRINIENYSISKQMTATESAVYLKYMGKNAVVKNYSYDKLSLGILNNNKDIKLLKNTFNNLKIRN